MTQEDQSKSLEVVYNESAKVAHAFWEWRHKVLTRYYIGLTSLVVVSGWLYNVSDLKRFTFVPFLMASIFSFISYALDSRNAVILRLSYSACEDIEKLLSNEKGFFSRLNEIHYNSASFTVLLKRLYLGSAVVLLILSVLLFCFTSMTPPQQKTLSTTNSIKDMTKQPSKGINPNTAFATTKPATPASDPNTTKLAIENDKSPEQTIQGDGAK